MKTFSVFLESRKDYSDEEKQKVWKKGNPAINSKTKQKLPQLRFDEYGALMKFEDYGNRDSEFGWEIDHIDEDPQNNAFTNLRPLFWRNNCARNANSPDFYHFNTDSQKNEVKR